MSEKRNFFKVNESDNLKQKLKEIIFVKEIKVIIPVGKFQIIENEYLYDNGDNSVDCFIIIEFDNLKTMDNFLKEVIIERYHFKCHSIKSVTSNHTDNFMLISNVIGLNHFEKQKLSKKRQIALVRLNQYLESQN